MITYEESLKMPEDRLEEIINGQIRRLPPATDRHEYLIFKLAEILRAQLPREEYVIMSSGLGLGITRRPVLSYRIPDLMVFQVRDLQQDRQEKDEDDPYVWKAPHLLVECLSPANRKGSVQKLLDDYATIKVPDAWLLYPKRRLLKAYAYRDGILCEMQHIENGLVYPLQLPKVEVDLSELWRAFEQGIF